MSPSQGWPQRRYLAIGGLVLVGLGVQMASAAGLGTIVVDKIASDTAPLTCAALTVGQTYKWTTPTTYSIATVTISGVPTNCQGKLYSMTFAQGDTTGAVIGTTTTTTGTLDPDASTTVTLTTAQQPNLDLVNNTTSNVKIIILVGGN